jgi:hypothetical protein
METSTLSSTKARETCKEAHAPVTANRQLEAARYALLQRLTPGIRHQVAGAFQPLMMLAAALQRLAQTPEVDLVKIGNHCASMHGFSHSGATSSLECLTWFSAAECADIGVNDGVSECLSLVVTELALREFTIINDLQMCVARWPRDALRSVFMAALLAITDEAPSPAELFLSSESTAKGLVLTLKVHSADDASVRESVPIYRKIEWVDVALLAEAEKVGLERVAGGVRLSLLPTA